MNTETPANFAPEELARRRRGATRLAWCLGLFVLLLYVGGMFVKR